MTDTNTYPAPPPYPAPSLPAPPKNNGKWKIVLGGALLLFIGVGLGSAGGGGTPQSCLDALDYADEGFGVASDVMGEVQIALGEVAAFNAAGINASTERIALHGEDMTALVPKYNSTKAACRAG